MTRIATINRTTKETSIAVKLKLDGTGNYTINSGVPFLDHMLALFSVHGAFDLQLTAKGDTDVDDHHTVEDIGICLGQAIAEALQHKTGDKIGIVRYGDCFMPMDETLIRVILDLSNRPYLHYKADVKEPKLGNFDTMLSKEFFRALSQHGGITLHIDLLHGENGHHIIEAVFKGFARALAMAVQPLSGRFKDRVMSSKGCL